LAIRDLWIWGITPPPAIVALIKESSSSSPLTANWRCLGVILLTLSSLLAFPANSRTSAVKYSNIAAVYTAAVTPTRFFALTWPFKILWILPTGNCRPALVDFDWGAFLPFPAFPPLPPFPPFPLGYELNFIKKFFAYHFFFTKLFNNENSAYIIKWWKILFDIIGYIIWCWKEGISKKIGIIRKKKITKLILI